jgi:hypothetical protein
MKRWRKMTWAIIAWSTLMLVWIVAGIASASSKVDEACGSGLYQQDCRDAYTAGAGVGVGLLIGLWFMGFVVLALVWFMTRPKDPVRVQLTDEERAELAR